MRPRSITKSITRRTRFVTSTIAGTVGAISVSSSCGATRRERWRSNELQIANCRLQIWTRQRGRAAQHERAALVRRAGSKRGMGSDEIQQAGCGRAAKVLELHAVQRDAEGGDGAALPQRVLG